MKPLIAIVGPTATGKSALALALAREIAGEVINADSRQVYRGIDIGTGKPSPQERAQVPHHLFDLVAPDQEFSVALYQRLAHQAIGVVQGRGLVPLLVGGSGLYVWAVIEGLRLPQVSPDAVLRMCLEEKAKKEGPESLHKELITLDPVGASRIDPRNVRRVIRALEVSQLLGIPFSQVGKRQPPPYETLVIGLTCTRAELYHRIDQRVDAMLARGWLEEVRGLLVQGYGPQLPALSSLGYRELAASVRGELPWGEVVQRIKFETHRFARHQYAWFRLKDPRIHWLDISQDRVQERALELAQRFLAR
jgi:tRNA dimethylallyltransferase